MTPGPADEARRALRAARRLRETTPPPRQPDDTEPAPPPASTRPAPDTAHAGGTAGGRSTPGAADTGRAADAPGTGDIADASYGADASGTVSASHRPETASRDPHRSRDVSGTGATPRRTTGERPDGARPGDAARQALRTALAARQSRTDGAAEGRRDASRPSPPAPRSGSVPRTEAAVRARAVRELLANAFRLPTDADAAEGAPAPAAQSPDPSRPPGRPEPPKATEPPVASEPPAPQRADASPAPSRTGASPLPQAGAPSQERPSPSGSPTGRTPSSGPAAGSRSTPRAAEPGRSETPAAPQVPRSMAAPGRDGEHRRTFPAFPGRATADGGFAETWWGQAWVTALEEGALDPERLARGRRYAERGHVDAITVTPGQVLAYVRGSRPRPYRVRVELRTLDDAAWQRLLDTAADRPGHIAALLDKELPHSLADCGVPLLPGPGDLVPHCNCPDSGHPCKHAAALCYQTARLLDADPFVLLLLRGRGQRELIDALSRLSAARAARAARSEDPAPLPGVRASEALAPRRLPPLPPPLPAPAHPEQPPVYPAAPGGPDPFALDQLATEAASRAHALLTTGHDPVGELTLWQDAVRLAAARPGSGLTAATRALYATLAAATGRTAADLARAVAAWRQGGLEGLTVLEEPWDPPAGRFDRARPLLRAADFPAFRPWRNHLTHPHGHLQLRLGRDGLWYAYESEPGRDDWWPRGTPDHDPVGALTGLGMTGGP